MLVFLETPFLVLHFSYHKSVTVLMRISVILLYMVITLFSTENVIRNLTHGNNWSWPLNLHLANKTLSIRVGSGLLIPMLKSKPASYDQSNNSGAIDVKMDGSFLEEKMGRIVFFF